MSTVSSIKSRGNKHDVQRGKDCMKKFCESLREHAMRIINFKKKKWNYLRNSNRNHMKMQKSVIYIKEKCGNKYVEDKRYHKVKDQCHYTGEYGGAAHSICDLKYSVSEKIPIAPHNGCNYDDRFMIKELPGELQKQFIY